MRSIIDTIVGVIRTFLPNNLKNNYRDIYMCTNNGPYSLVMIKDPSKNSWIQMVIWIPTKTKSSVPCAIVNFLFN